MQIDVIMKVSSHHLDSSGPDLMCFGLIVGEIVINQIIPQLFGW